MHTRAKSSVSSVSSVVIKNKKPITMAEIFMPMLDALKECAAFTIFMVFSVAFGYLFYGALYLLFGHKSETIRCIWYCINGIKTYKRNGKIYPIRNRKSDKTAA